MRIFNLPSDGILPIQKILKILLQTKSNDVFNQNSQPKKAMAIVVFSDFDATISVQDVGDTLFQHYGRWPQHWAEYSAGECDIKELNRRLCRSLDAGLSLADIARFAVEQPIDPYFGQFYRFCQQNSIRLTIVSDGYDAYIEPIMAHHQMQSIPLYCNTLVQVAEGFEAKFFGATENCTCSTASCKRNVVLNNSAEEDIVVYIGDGHTDFCAASFSDIIFAKAKLAAYCNKERLPHYPFKTFFDIYRLLENSIKSRTIRPRHQARMKRKVAFEAE